MKIGIDASRYTHESATGVEWYSFYLINALLKLLKGGKDEVVLYSRKKLDLPGNKVIKGSKMWTLRHLSNEMRVSPPDVLFVPSHTLPLALPQRSVITIHDIAFKYLKKSYSLKQYMYLNWSTGFAVKKADAIIVPSQATADDLMQFFGCPEDKLHVVHHGFVQPQDVNVKKVVEESEVLKYFGINGSMKFGLFVGRLESKKNLVRLVQSFAKASEKHPEFKLVLAGKRGVGFKKLWKEVRKLGLVDKVIMPGYVTEEEKAALYKLCKFALLPSLYEGFGLPVLEAFYYGKPMMCSNAASLPEVAGEAAHFVDPYQVEEMAQGLEKLLTDEQYGNELVKKGQERLKDFDWQTAAEKTLKVIYG